MNDNAQQLVKEFIAEKLNGDLYALESFDFKTLRDSEKYGAPDRSFDCDDTNIMRAVYVVLWGDSLPYLSLHDIGSGKNYRGDTMNTFHTMFGREIPEKPGFFAGLEKYSPSDEMREKVRNFGRLCSNIGNFCILPNRNCRRTTLNCYRGTNQWRDFFDRFLIELHRVLDNADVQDDTLKELVAKNDFCFSKFKGTAGFAGLRKILLFDDYLDPESELPHEIFPLNYHWKNIEKREQYLLDAEKYLAESERIILHRADMMIRILAEKLAV